MLSFVQNSGVPAHRDKPWALIVRQKTSSRLYWFPLSSTLPAACSRRYTRASSCFKFYSRVTNTKSFARSKPGRVRARTGLEIEIYRKIQSTHDGSRRRLETRLDRDSSGLPVITDNAVSTETRPKGRGGWGRDGGREKPDRDRFGTIFKSRGNPNAGREDEKGCAGRGDLR